MSGHYGEKEVAVLVYLELTNPEIARRLVLSPNTVKTHIRHILAKFGLISREELRRELAGLDFSDFLNNRFASGVPPHRFRLTPWGYWTSPHVTTPGDCPPLRPNRYAANVWTAHPCQPTNRA
ncbi:MAG: helix-turn-helix transcriptional regulator [Chloroflexi bacterium]|nr:helix-turn-helix transcriptional regulator [Chloroflexota bacterium]